MIGVDPIMAFMPLAVGISPVWLVATLPLQFVGPRVESRSSDDLIGTELIFSQSRPAQKNA